MTFANHPSCVFLWSNWGGRGTVVARWAAGQQFELLIRHLGQFRQTFIPLAQVVPRPNITSVHCGLKHHSYIHLFILWSYFVITSIFCLMARKVGLWEATSAQHFSISSYRPVLQSSFDTLGRNGGLSHCFTRLIMTEEINTWNIQKGVRTCQVDLYIRY